MPFLRFAASCSMSLTAYNSCAWPLRRGQRARADVGCWQECLREVDRCLSTLRALPDEPALQIEAVTPCPVRRAVPLPPRQLAVYSLRALTSPVLPHSMQCSHALRPASFQPIAFQTCLGVLNACVRLGGCVYSLVDVRAHACGDGMTWRVRACVRVTGLDAGGFSRCEPISFGCRWSR